MHIYFYDIKNTEDTIFSKIFFKSLLFNFFSARL